MVGSLQSSSEGEVSSKPGTKDLSSLNGVMKLTSDSPDMIGGNIAQRDAEVAGETNVRVQVEIGVDVVLCHADHANLKDETSELSLSVYQMCPSQNNYPEKSISTVKA